MKKLFIGILFSFMIISNANAGFFTFVEANSANYNAKKAIEQSKEVQVEIKEVKQELIEIKNLLHEIKVMVEEKDEEN